MRRYNYFGSVCLLFNISIEANSVDPDQTALDLHRLFKRLHDISIDDKKHTIGV